jgi:hypothetical protein
MTPTEMLADQVETMRRMTLDTFATFSESEQLFQPAPGLNHPLWLLGHIAGSEDHLILDFCAAQPQLPAAYAKLFGIGSQPSPERSAYPPASEILERLAQVHVTALAWLRSASPEDLARKPTSCDKLPERPRSMFTSRGRCSWFHATHEATHLGQLSYLRRLLGKPPRF